MTGVQCRRSALAVGSILLVSCLQSFAQSGSSSQPLELVEALQSTLANQPALQIQQQQVVSSKAVRQQTSGAFDTLTQASFSQNRVNNPLTIFNQEQAALLGITTLSEMKRERLAPRGPVRGFLGTVSEAIDLIGQYQDAGIELLIVSDRPNDAETRDLFVSDVMPHFA